MFLDAEASVFQNIYNGAGGGGGRKHSRLANSSIHYSDM